jgi:ATP-binding cassette subfamily B protein
VNAITHVADGSIEFDHVPFSYSRHADKRFLTMCRSVSSPGRSGGPRRYRSLPVEYGQLIPRLFRSIGCSIKVGGVDVRTRFGCVAEPGRDVLQVERIVFGTIKENLRWGDENATDDVMKRACGFARRMNYQSVSRWLRYVYRAGVGQCLRRTASAAVHRRRC